MICKKRKKQLFLIFVLLCLAVVIAITVLADTNLADKYTVTINEEEYTILSSNEVEASYQTFVVNADEGIARDGLVLTVNDTGNTTLDLSGLLSCLELQYIRIVSNGNLKRVVLPYKNTLTCYISAPAIGEIDGRGCLQLNLVLSADPKSINTSDDTEIYVAVNEPKNLDFLKKGNYSGADIFSSEGVVPSSQCDIKVLRLTGSDKWDLLPLVGNESIRYMTIVGGTKDLSPLQSTNITELFLAGEFDFSQLKDMPNLDVLNIFITEDRQPDLRTVAELGEMRPKCLRIGYLISTGIDLGAVKDVSEVEAFCKKYPYLADYTEALTDFVNNGGEIQTFSMEEDPFTGSSPYEKDISPITFQHVRIAWSNDYSGTERGHYGFLPWQRDSYEEISPWIFRANLTFFDISSRSFSYLCTDEGCMHNNEKCTSYIRASCDLSVFSSYNEAKMYIISKGADHCEVYSTDDPGMIVEANPDGSSRRILYRLAYNESFKADTPIAISEDYIYTPLLIYGNNDEDVKAYLYRFSTSESKKEQLLQLGADDFIFAAYGENLIITRCDPPDENSLQPGEPIIPITSQFIYNVNTGEVSELTGPDMTYTLCQDEKLIRAEKAEGIDIDDLFRNIPVAFNIYQYSLDDTEESKIGTIHLPSEPAGYSSLSCFSHYIIVTYIERESDTERRIAFDLDVGEQKELTLSIKSDSAKKIRILQETEEYFVVVMDRNNATITQTDGNGVCHTYNMLNAPVYALMKKDDFFNDVPVYLYVENSCWDFNSLFL